MINIGQFTIGLIVTTLLAIAYAHVFTYQWNVLVVPAFGIFKITVIQSYVIMAVKGLLFLKFPNGEEEEEDFTTQIITTILYGGVICIISLFFTWVTTLILF